MSTPRNTMRPPLGRTRPESARRVEVFPAPLGPMIATISPSSTLTETPATAATFPEWTERSVSSSTRLLRAQIGFDHRGIRLDLARRPLGDPNPVIDHGHAVADT